MNSSTSNSNDYDIRPGNSCDLPLLGAIERDAAELFPEIGYEFCADGPVRDEDEQRTALETCAVFVACTPDGRICGFSLVWRIDGCAHLLELAVSRDHQGNRLGRRLIDASEAWASGAGMAVGGVASALI